MIVRYAQPRHWLTYHQQVVQHDLTQARAALLALSQMPFQRSWAETLQQVQLKREVAGTSRIEGAEFTEKELDAALRETPEQLATRSQKQAAAAKAAYEWIGRLPLDKPVTRELVLAVHRQLVTGCDEDHCPPGQLRKRDQNVTFGAPRHRGAEGGAPCQEAFASLLQAVNTVFREHDPVIQALALHYHLAAMHPFLDGNGRTARAMEALLLQRAGLRDTLFIAMSNYYYENKTAYLNALNDTQAAHHDLTAFLVFGLRGVAAQAGQLLGEIRHQVAKALYRNTVTDLFGRLKTPRKRVMTERQVRLLNLLLEEEKMFLDDLLEQSRHFYDVKAAQKTFFRDLNDLLRLGAIHLVDKPPASKRYSLAVDLAWPTQITETEFFERVKNMPKSKRLSFLSQ